MYISSVQVIQTFSNSPIVITGPAARDSHQMNGDLHDRIRSLRDVGSHRQPGPLARRFHPQRMNVSPKKSPYIASGASSSGRAPLHYPLAARDRQNCAPSPDWEARSSDCDTDSLYYRSVRSELQDSGVDLDNLQETAILGDDVGYENSQTSPTATSPSAHGVSSTVEGHVKDLIKQEIPPDRLNNQYSESAFEDRQLSTNTPITEKAQICGSVFLV